MRIEIWRRGGDWADPFERAFAEGLALHGITPEVLELGAAPSGDAPDLAVMWGHNRREIQARQRAAGRDYLVIERGYVGDRFVFASIGLNGLNGRAEFNTADKADDDSRWRKHFADLMAPWRDVSNGVGDCLVMGQVAGDASVRNVNITRWYQEIVDQIRRHRPGQRIRFRVHPNQKQRSCPAHAIAVDHDEPLTVSLSSARFVVTFNSNSGVDAVLAGVPTVTLDEGAMAWPVTSHDLARPFYQPDRTAWANRLAWCQWSVEEIASGEAWAHIRGAVGRGSGAERARP